MQTYNQTYQGAATSAFAVPGKYFRLMKTTTPVDVTLYSNGQAVYQATQVEAGFYAVPKNGFDRFEIASGAAQTIQLAVSDGFGGYDRSVGTVSISGNPSVMLKTGATITMGAPSNFGTTAVQVASAQAGTKALYFLADPANTAPIYLGGSTVTDVNAAIRLNPGDTYIEDRCAEAAWWVISTAAGQKIRYMRGS